jgi:hypothetical protein
MQVNEKLKDILRGRTIEVVSKEEGLVKVLIKTASWNTQDNDLDCWKETNMTEQVSQTSVPELSPRNLAKRADCARRR